MQNHVVWRIKCKNPLRGLTCGCIEEKKGIYKEKFLRIFHPFVEKLPWRNLHKILSFKFHGGPVENHCCRCLRSSSRVLLYLEVKYIVSGFLVLYLAVSWAKKIGNRLLLLFLFLPLVLRSRGSLKINYAIQRWVQSSVCRATKQHWSTAPKQKSSHMIIIVIIIIIIILGL